MRTRKITMSSRSSTVTIPNSASKTPSPERVRLPHLNDRISRQKKLESDISQLYREFKAGSEVVPLIATKTLMLTQLSPELVGNLYAPIHRLTSHNSATTQALGLRVLQHVVKLINIELKSELIQAIIRDLPNVGPMGGKGLALMLYELSKEMKAPSQDLSHSLKMASHFLKEQEEKVLLQAARLAAPDDRVFLASLYAHLTQMYFDKKDTPKASQAADNAFAASAKCDFVDDNLGKVLADCSRRLLKENAFEHAEKLSIRVIQIKRDPVKCVEEYLNLITSQAKQPTKRERAVESVEFVVTSLSGHFKHNPTSAMRPGFYVAIYEAASVLLYDANAALAAEKLIRLGFDSLASEPRTAEVALSHRIMLLECYLAQEKTEEAEQLTLDQWSLDAYSRSRMSAELDKTVKRLQNKNEKQVKSAEKLALYAKLLNSEPPRDANEYLNQLMRFLDIGIEMNQAWAVTQRAEILHAEMVTRKNVLAKADNLLENITKVFKYATAESKESKNKSMIHKVYLLIQEMANASSDPQALGIKLQAEINMAELGENQSYAIESLLNTLEKIKFTDADLGKKLDDFVKRYEPRDTKGVNSEKLKSHAIRLISSRDPVYCLNQHLELARYQLYQKKYSDADVTIIKACNLAKDITPPNDDMSKNLFKFASSLNAKYALVHINMLLAQAMRLLSDTPANKKQQIILRLHLVNILLDEKKADEAQPFVKEAQQLAEKNSDTELSKHFYNSAKRFTEAKLPGMARSCFVSAFEQGSPEQKESLVKQESKNWEFMQPLLDKYPDSSFIDRDYLYNQALSIANFAMLKYLIILKMAEGVRPDGALSEKLQGNLSSIATLREPNGLDFFQGMPADLLGRIMSESLWANDNDLFQVPPQRLNTALQRNNEHEKAKNQEIAKKQQQKFPVMDAATLSIHYFRLEYKPWFSAEKEKHKEIVIRCMDLGETLRALLRENYNGDFLDKAARHLLYDEFKKLGRAATPLTLSVMEKSVDQVFKKKKQMDVMIKKIIDGIFPPVCKREDQKHKASSVFQFTDRERVHMQIELGNAIARYCPDTEWNDAAERQCLQELEQLLLERRTSALRERKTTVLPPLYLSAHNPPTPHVNITFFDEQRVQESEFFTLHLYEADFKALVEQVFSPSKNGMRCVR